MLTRNAYAFIASFLAGSMDSTTAGIVTATNFAGTKTSTSARNCQSMFSKLRYVRTSYNVDSGGISFSGSEAAPTVDDYSVPEDGHISTVSVSGSDNINLVTNDDGSHDVVVPLSVTNTGSSDIVIKSLYYFGYANTAVLIDHTKLANPITIPAGETKVISYMIHLDISA